MGKFDKLQKQETLAKKRQCKANGCPVYPTFTPDTHGAPDSDNWICRYHDGRAAEKWNHITTSLRQNQSLVGWFHRLLEASWIDWDKLKTQAPKEFWPEGEIEFGEYREKIRLELQKRIYNYTSLAARPDLRKVFNHWQFGDEL